MTPDIPFETSILVMVPVVIVLASVFIVAVFRVLSRERDNVSSALDVTYEAPKPDHRLV